MVSHWETYNISQLCLYNLHNTINMANLHTIKALSLVLCCAAAQEMMRFIFPVWVEFSMSSCNQECQYLQSEIKFIKTYLEITYL